MTYRMGSLYTTPILTNDRLCQIIRTSKFVKIVSSDWMISTLPSSQIHKTDIFQPKITSLIHTIMTKTDFGGHFEYKNALYK